jgi:hypothetical protein
MSSAEPWTDKVEIAIIFFIYFIIERREGLDWGDSTTKADGRPEGREGTNEYRSV